jgi:hypothetical protein
LTVSESGVYSVYISNACGADTASVTVTVNTSPPQPLITRSGNTLQSSSPTGNQWYLNGNIINGATASTYSPTVSGLYTVQVTQNGCSATSTGYNFIITGINSPELDRQLLIGPNPVRGTLYIRYTGTGASFIVQVMDMTGRKVHEGKMGGGYMVDMEALRAGVYIIRVVQERTGDQVQRTVVKY